MLQALKSVSGLGKNKSQNALSLDGQLVTDQILIANNLNEIFTSIGQTKANNIPLSIKTLHVFFTTTRMQIICLHTT